MAAEVYRFHDRVIVEAERRARRRASRRGPPRERVMQTHVTGLAEMQYRLRQIDKQLAALLNKQLRQVPAPVRDEARRRYYRAYQRRTGRSQYGITSGLRYGAAFVRLGAAGRAHLLGQEWGSHDLRQFPPWPQPEGLFFWRPVKDAENEIAERMDVALGRAARQIEAASAGRVRL